MAVRLSVIMIQSNPPTATAQRMAEEVVGKLIGAEGIDLTLVGPLSSLAKTATDRLTLETLAGDVAALDWQEPEAILNGLAAVDFQAHRAPHPHDDEAPAPTGSGRRVFAFDMNRFRGSSELVAALQQLNARRQVRTFSIGIGASRGSEGSPKDSRPTTPQVVEPVAKNSPPRVPATRKPGLPGDVGLSQDSPAVQPGSTQALDLDDLLDQLDQADP